MIRRILRPHESMGKASRMAGIQSRPRPMEHPSDDLAGGLAGLRALRPPTAAPHMTCQSCSAVFLRPADGAPLRCPYCHTVNVIDAKNTVGRMAPDRVLLATIDEAYATEALHRWGKENRADTSQALLEGVYLPFWTFEISGEILSPQVRRDPRQPGSDISLDIARVANTLKPRPGVAEYLSEVGRAEPLIDRLPVSRSACLPRAGTSRTLGSERTQLLVPRPRVLRHLRADGRGLRVVVDPAVGGRGGARGEPDCRLCARRHGRGLRRLAVGRERGLSVGGLLTAATNSGREPAAFRRTAPC